VEGRRARRPIEVLRGRGEVEEREGGRAREKLTEAFLFFVLLVSSRPTVFTLLLFLSPGSNRCEQRREEQPCSEFRGVKAREWVERGRRRKRRED